MLQLNTTSDYRKAEFFLSTVCTKGPEGEKNFVKALYEISKQLGNSGYTDVICKLQQKRIVISETFDHSTNVLTDRCAGNQSITSFNIN